MLKHALIVNIIHGKKKDMAVFATAKTSKEHLEWTDIAYPSIVPVQVFVKQVDDLRPAFNRQSINSFS